MEKTKNARQIALEILKKSEKSGQYSNIALDNALKRCSLEESDRALCTAIFYGVIERKITLDCYISALSSRPIDKIDGELLMILRMGIYQLAYLDKIPDHAAIYETVALCTAKTKGFVNAVLRSYTREKEKIKLPNSSDEPYRALSVRYSVGEALVRRLCDTYGKERCESILSSLERKSATTLRANTLKVSRDELVSLVGGEASALSPFGVKTRGRVTELYGFSDGLFYVQDEASQICAASLGAKRGETVVDTCACPGSKSFGIAIDMENEGEIYSFDLHANKLSLVVSSAKRLGIDIIRVEERDARRPKQELLGKVDRVLCDVPCSGFGVLAKKPELRYKDPNDLRDLPAIQYDILTSSAKYLRAGGTLVYSTCTVFPEENEKNVERFLSEHSEFELCGFKVGAFECEEGMVRFLGDEYGTDGFFIAKLIKRR